MRENSHAVVKVTVAGGCGKLRKAATKGAEEQPKKKKRKREGLLRVSEGEGFGSSRG